MTELQRLQLFDLKANPHLLQHAKLLVRRVGVEEKGWPVEGYLERYSKNSQAWVVLDGTILAGIVLLIEGNPAEFPIRSKEGWPELTILPGKTVEIPYVLVEKKYRGCSGASFALCAATHWYCVREGVDHIELTLDKQLYGFYEYHGINMVPITAENGGGIKRHWGESGIFPARLKVGCPEEPGSMGYGVRTHSPELWASFEYFRSTVLVAAD